MGETVGCVGTRPYLKSKCMLLFVAFATIASWGWIIRIFGVPVAEGSLRVEIPVTGSWPLYLLSYGLEVLLPCALAAIGAVWGLYCLEKWAKAKQAAQESLVEGKYSISRACRVALVFLPALLLFFGLWYILSVQSEWLLVFGNDRAMGVFFVEVPDGVAFPQGMVGWVVRWSLPSFFVLALLDGWLRPEYPQRVSRTPRQKALRISLYIASVLLFALAGLFYLLQDWLVHRFGTVTTDMLLFQLQVPLEGTGDDVIQSFVFQLFLPAMLWMAAAMLLLYMLGQMVLWPRALLQKLPSPEPLTLPQKPLKAGAQILEKGLLLVLPVCIMGNSVFKTLDALQFDAYLSSRLSNEYFFDDHYVDGKSVSLTFPEQKRNLIFIFLESMEATLLSPELGGAQPVNIIPELGELALENTNFSNSDQLGGAIQLANTSWTLAGMICQNAGVGLNLVWGWNGDYTALAANGFLPGVYALGDVLRDNGYRQMLMVGSNASYAGRRDFYTVHGGYEIKDLYTAWEEGVVPQGYSVWWGIEDYRLYDYAKSELVQLAAGDQPFNFTMLTVDTHADDGYFCPYCQHQNGEQYKDVFACASRQAAAFVQWIQQQEFYENTTIVITGDHLYMNNGLTEEAPKGYDRTTLNVFINPAVTATNTKNRMFTTMDIFPTTLAAMGISIEGERMGMGTNLFSNQQTLVEQYGREQMNQAMRQRSPRYDELLGTANAGGSEAA